MNPFPKMAWAACAGLLCVAPLRGQILLSPVDSISVPTYLAPGEAVVGLGVGFDGPDLALYTAERLFTSPIDVRGSMAFTDTGVVWASWNVNLNVTSRTIFSPTDANEAFLTGGGGRGGILLYTTSISILHTSVSATSVTLSGFAASPTGFAADTSGEIFLSSATAGAGIFRLPDSNTGTPDLNFGTSGPGALNTSAALAMGPDGLLYVLDTGDDRIVSFTTDGVYRNSFTLTGAAVGSALAIDPNGDLYTMNADGGGDIYDIFTGTHIGAIADTGDINFNDNIGQPSLFYADGYLFSTTGTGANVYVYSVVPEPAAWALSAGGAALLAVVIRRRKTGKKV
jgi:hypothetical protein